MLIKQNRIRTKLIEAKSTSLLEWQVNEGCEGSTGGRTGGEGGVDDGPGGGEVRNPKSEIRHISM